MGEVNTVYKCPKCSNICSSFVSLCRHVQYDHELWYLGKGHAVLSSSAFPSSITLVPNTENSKIISDSTAVKQPLDTPLKIPTHSATTHDVMRNALFRQLEEQEKKLFETKTKLEEEVFERYNIQKTMQALAQKNELLQNEVDRLHLELTKKDGITNNISSVQEVPLQNLKHQRGRFSSLDARSDKLPFSCHSTPVNFVRMRNMRNSNIPAAGEQCLHKVHSDSCISCTGGTPNRFVNMFDHHYPSTHGVDLVGYPTARENNDHISDNYITVATCTSQDTIPYFSAPAQHDSVLSGHISHPSSVISQPISSITALHKFPLQMSHCSKNTISQVSQTDSGKGDSVITKSHDGNAKTEDGQEIQQVFKLVFYYLDTDSLLSCRAVCRYWRYLIEQPQYWISVHLMHRCVTPELLHMVSQWCTSTQSLTIQAITVPRRQKNKSQFLHETRGLLESGLEALLRSAQHTLTTLSIVSCGNLFTERSLWLVSCHSHHLTRFAYFSQYYPATPEALWSLGSGCRKLHTLIIPPLYPSFQPERFSNRCLLMIAKCWSHLRVLCIGGTEVEVSGIIAIVRHCQKLEILELDHMGEIQEQASVAICRDGLQKLERFYFTHTPVCPSAIKHIYSACPRLKVMGIILGPMDYFVHPDYSPNKEEYHLKVQQLKDLMKQPGLKNILQIKVQ